MNNDEKLIELVKAHRAIYDKTDVFYSNKDYVKELWQEIAKDMNQTVPVCQKRWRYLRDYFVRQLHMTQNQNAQQQQQQYQHQENGTNDNSMITSSSLSSSEISEKISTTETSYNLTVTPTTNNNNNNTSNNNAIQNNNNKKKTYWAFYDKMLFLKPFSSTRKSKPKNDERNIIDINRRQSQGHINNNKMITSTATTSSEIHTVSDSNSVDDEFDSFDYMQMYQMQFGTDIDKAELQCNGALYHTATTTTTNIDDFQHQQQQQQLNQQKQQLQNSIIEQNQQSSNYDTSTTIMTTINKDIQSSSYQQVPQNQKKSMKLVYSNNNNNKLNSNNIRPSTVHTKKNNVNVATASTSTSTSTSMLSTTKRKLHQQQKTNVKILNSNPQISEKSSSLITEEQKSSKLPIKKRKRSEICEEILDILKKSDLDDNNDEHAMFFKSLLNSVRKIDEEHILSFRTEIIQIIMKYRYISQQNDKNSCCSGSSNNSDVVVVDTGEMHWRHKLPC